MRDSLIVTQDVTKQDCPWLDGTVERGTIVYRYFGATYGCIGSGWAVTLEPDTTPFFELPRGVLAPAPSPAETEKGEARHG